MRKNSAAKPVSPKATLSKKAVLNPLGVAKAMKKSPIKAKKKPVLKSDAKNKTSIPLQQKESGVHARVPIRDNTVVAKAIKPILRPPLEPVIQSPYRFPMIQEKSVVRVAHYVGMFFVAFGAVFSFLHITSVSNMYASIPFLGNVATLLSSTTTTALPGTQLDQTNTISTTNTTDPTPDVRIVVEAGEILSNTVPVVITVPYATEVKMLLEFRNDGHTVVLGSALRVDNSTWRYIWSTANYPDGEYRLKTLIRNEFGTYTHAPSTTYIIKNTSQTTDQSSAVTDTNTDTTTSTTTTGVSDTESTQSTSTAQTLLRTISLHVLEDSPLRGGVPLKISVQDASEVKLYARNTKSLSLFYVGLAQYDRDDVWKIEWKTGAVPDGEYSLRAKAKVGDELLNSEFVEVTVKNNSDITTAPTTQSTSSVPVEADLQQHIGMKFSQVSPFTKTVDIQVEADGVTWVELYALPRNSLAPHFIGLAKRMTDTTWKLVWDTGQSPNGEYHLYARVKTLYGFIEGDRSLVRIQNEIVANFTPLQEKTLDTFTEVKNILTVETSGMDSVVEPASSTEEKSIDPVKQTYVEPVGVFMERIDIRDESKTEIETMLIEFKTRLHEKLNELSQAIREKDTDKVSQIKSEIESLKNAVIQNVPQSFEKQEILDSINSYVSKLTFELQELTINNESILRERIGDAITTDTDKDGISDYDEVNLYKTNPFTADTDGDSYIDGAEIARGFNPHDSSSEALVTYESPKETGVVRDDLLRIDSITTLPSSEEKGEGDDVSKEGLKAIISGVGLPNSFVTLYIYSTPIVVTVRTDADGGWSYIFDKELENGNHEVYVGITDNAGRVVAKSNPLPFVKTAEAFTKADSVSAAIQAEEIAPQLIGGKILLLIASILIVVFGLILVFIGLHVSNKKVLESEAPSS